MPGVLAPSRENPRATRAAAETAASDARSTQAPVTARLRLVLEPLLGHLDQRPEQLRELHREDELRRRARTQRLQGLQVLQRHRLAVDRLGDLENRVERQREPFGAQNR